MPVTPAENVKEAKRTPGTKEEIIDEDEYFLVSRRLGWPLAGRLSPFWSSKMWTGVKSQRINLTSPDRRSAGYVQHYLHDSGALDESATISRPTGTACPEELVCHSRWADDGTPLAYPPVLCERRCKRIAFSGLWPPSCMAIGSTPRTRPRVGLCQDKTLSMWVLERRAHQPSPVLNNWQLTSVRIAAGCGCNLNL